jgi:DNA-binding transcriptional regulator LsrR (DeoR family)
VIAVAGGVAKTAAIRAVLRGHAITSLVTDADVASGLLARDAPADSSGRLESRRGGAG